MDIGRKTYLTNEEEISLVNYIKYMCSHGFPLNIKQIRGYTWGIVLQNGRSDQFKESDPSEKWWRGFKKCHAKEITLQKPDNLDRGRTSMANKLVMERHFETLKKILMENDLLDKPEKIFNTDESGILFAFFLICLCFSKKYLVDKKINKNKYIK